MKTSSYKLILLICVVGFTMTSCTKMELLKNNERGDTKSTATGLKKPAHPGARVIEDHVGCRFTYQLGFEPE